MGRLRQEAAEAEAELEGARAQLALADPDGFFVAGSAAAHAAAAKAAATARLEEQRREARQRQRLAAVVGRPLPSPHMLSASSKGSSSFADPARALKPATACGASPVPVVSRWAWPTRKAYGRGNDAWGLPSALAGPEGAGGRAGIPLCCGGGGEGGGRRAAARRSRTRPGHPQQTRCPANGSSARGPGPRATSAAGQRPAARRAGGGGAGAQPPHSTPLPPAAPIRSPSPRCLSAASDGRNTCCRDVNPVSLNCRYLRT